MLNSGGFGQAKQQVQNGTGAVKFACVDGSENLTNGNNLRTKNHSITAMAEYESKSFEELRVDDYIANRKGKCCIYYHNLRILCYP